MGKRPHRPTVAREAWLDVFCFISELGQYAYKNALHLLDLFIKKGKKKKNFDSFYILFVLLDFLTCERVVI